MDLSTFLLAVLLLELTPGPNMAYLAALALSAGRTAALVATAGVAAGLGVHAVVAAFGVGALVQNSALLYETLRWIGVAYLFYLAWEGWWPEKESSPGRADLLATAGPLFMRGFLSNVFNPKSILFFVSVVPTFVVTRSGDPAIPLQLTVLGALYVGVATVIHASIVLSAARLRPWLVEGPRHLWVRRTLSIALALVAVWLVWTTRR
jgi:threonine/homoserine/homoserine lactone efflux protein